MPSRQCFGLAIFLGSALIASFAVLPAYSQQVWSGLTYTFEKPSFADSTQAEFQDRITDTIWFTRGNSMGLVNAFTECNSLVCSYAHNFSPEGTEWATDLIEANDGLDIEAVNWEQLTFTNWEAAYGGGGGLATYIVGASSVVHLIEEDIYIDIEFTAWGVSPGSGANVSYIRAEPSVVQTTGDYNGDGIVDAADYTVWRDTLGQNVEPGTGADGEPDGTIDVADYNFWKSKFGNVIEGAGAASIAVPEPATIVLMLGGLFVLATRRQRITPRGPGQDTSS